MAKKAEATQKAPGYLETERLDTDKHVQDRPTEQQYESTTLDSQATAEYDQAWQEVANQEPDADGSEPTGESSLEAIEPDTKLELQPGDKIVVKVNRRNMSAVEIERTRKAAEEFFGQGNVLVVSSDVEFYLLRQGRGDDDAARANGNSE